MTKEMTFRDKATYIMLAYDTKILKWTVGIFLTLVLVSTPIFALISLALTANFLIDLVMACLIFMVIGVGFMAWTNLPWTLGTEREIEQMLWAIVQKRCTRSELVKLLKERKKIDEIKESLLRSNDPSAQELGLALKEKRKELDRQFEIWTEGFVSRNEQKQLEKETDHLFEAHRILAHTELESKIK